MEFWLVVLPLEVPSLVSFIMLCVPGAGVSTIELRPYYFFLFNIHANPSPIRILLPHPCLEALVYPIPKPRSVVRVLDPNSCERIGILYRLFYPIFRFHAMLPEPGEVSSFTIFDSRLSPIDETQKIPVKVLDCGLNYICPTLTPTCGRADPTRPLSSTSIHFFTFSKSDI